MTFSLDEPDDRAVVATLTRPRARAPRDVSPRDLGRRADAQQ
jgi:hypothetical protein